MKQNEQRDDGRRSWVTPRLVRIGDLRSIVLGGGGKLSFAGSDPGDIRKAKGGG
jgi:hypothetical protein